MKSSVELDRILDVLIAHDVACIVVGGVAAVLQGAPIVTLDVDIVHQRTAANVTRLITALTSLGACYRHQHGRRIDPRADALSGPGHNLFMTNLGPLDALGALDGDDYDKLLGDVVWVDYGEARIQVLSLERLIEVKRAAGRPKDLRMLPELEATLAVIRARGAPREDDK